MIVASFPFKQSCALLVPRRRKQHRQVAPIASRVNTKEELGSPPAWSARKARSQWQGHRLHALCARLGRLRRILDRQNVKIAFRVGIKEALASGCATIARKERPRCRPGKPPAPFAQPEKSLLKTPQCSAPSKNFALEPAALHVLARRYFNVMK